MTCIAVWCCAPSNPRARPLPPRTPLLVLGSSWNPELIEEQLIGVADLQSEVPKQV